MRNACWLVLLLWVVSPCFGATYVVEQGGAGGAGVFSTIGSAAEVARAGDRVVIGPGVYRESVALRNSGTAEAPIVFEARIPGTVVVSGADPLTGWVRAPGELPLYVAPWSHVFAIDYRDGVAVEHHPDDAPLWGRAELVVVDGKLLLPVQSVEALEAVARSGRVVAPVRGLDPGFAGAFTVDRGAGKIWIWLRGVADPGKHVVEASTRGQLFGVNPWESAKGVHDVQVKGLIFRYGGTFPQRAAVWLHGSGNLVENCVIESMAGSGVEVSGTLRGCVIRNNGSTGGSALGDGFVNENCLWEGNSWKPISRDWEAGGAKVVDCERGVFRGCLFRANGGPGLWFDIDARDMTVEQCVFVGNEKSGVMVEISQRIRIKDNLFLNNAAGAVGEAGWGDGGIEIAESFDCQVTNNTCIGNKDGITVREQGPRAVQTQGGVVSFHVRDLLIERNRIENSRGYAIGLWYDNVFFGAHPNAGVDSPDSTVYDPARAAIQIDHNAYVGPKAGFLYGVTWRKKHQAMSSLADWRKATGFDKNSRMVRQGASSEAGWRDAPVDLDQWVRGRWPRWMGVGGRD